MNYTEYKIERGKGSIKDYKDGDLVFEGKYLNGMINGIVK